jgi:hypothetical protein
VALSYCCSIQCYRATYYRRVRREAKGMEGRQDLAALRYCCAIAFLAVSEFQQLPHGEITPRYKKPVDPLSPHEKFKLLA